MGWRLGRAAQEVSYPRQQDGVHDQPPQVCHGQVGGIRHVHQIAVPFHHDFTNVRMPCQGPADVQHSKATEQPIDFQAGTAETVRLVNCLVGDHVHIRPYPQITQGDAHDDSILYTMVRVPIA